MPPAFTLRATYAEMEPRLDAGEPVRLNEKHHAEHNGSQHGRLERVDQHFFAGIVFIIEKLHRFLLKRVKGDFSHLRLLCRSLHYFASP